MWRVTTSPTAILGDFGCEAARPPPGALNLLEAPLGRHWVSRSGGLPGWKLEDGVLEIVPGSEDLVTRKYFGDFQLHVEFWLPSMPRARGQDRANSGIYLQSRFEIQLLDSGSSPPALDGCGANYGIAAPRRNATLPAETWQSLDVVFRSATHHEDAQVTVLQNGLAIHNQLALALPTPGSLEVTGARGPLMLQEHGARLRFRNLWLLT
jgi:hypothetical protein